MASQNLDPERHYFVVAISTHMSEKSKVPEDMTLPEVMGVELENEFKDGSPSSLGRFQNIPLDIVKHILQFTRVPDLLAFTQACRYLREMVTSDVTIQYAVEAYFAGAQVPTRDALGGDVDALTRTSIRDRLRLLRRREYAWRHLEPTTREIIDISFQVGNLHGLRGGVLELGLASNTQSLDIQPSANLPSACSLKYALLSNKTESFTWKDWNPCMDINVEIQGTCVAFHENDLIVIITSSPTANDPESVTSEVRFIQLSTGLPHPLAPQPTLMALIYNRAETPFIGSSVLGQYVALVYTFWQPAVAHADRLLVFDWTAGTLLLDHDAYNTGALTGPEFISPTTLILGDSTKLDLWELAPAPRCIGSLLLPQSRVGVDFEIIHIHSDPSLACTYSRTIPSYPEMCYDPEESLTTFFTFFGPFKMLFVARRSGLRKAANKLRATTVADDARPPSLRYSDWATNIVRWIPADDLYPYWSMRNHGQRMVAIRTDAQKVGSNIIMYDFNPYHVKKWADEAYSIHKSNSSTIYTTPSDASHSATGPPLFLVKESHRQLPFTEWVDELPYITYQSEEKFQYGGVWMDGENIVGLKYNTSGIIEALDIMRFG